MGKESSPVIRRIKYGGSIKMKEDEVLIYGASDDLVEVDGSIREEFNYPYDE